MDDEQGLFKDPQLRTGYAGDEEPSGPEGGPPINKTVLSAEASRGKRAPRSGSGVVVGSGAGAGGAGGHEDFDSDAAGGGGAIPSPKDDHPKSGADAPVGGSR